MSSERAPAETVPATDVLIGCLLLIAGLTVSLALSSRWPTALNDASSDSANVWFQSDSGRVYENMTAARSNHYRASIHPLFSLLTYPPVYVMRTTVVSPWSAVRVALALSAGLLLLGAYLSLRLLALRHTDAALGAGLLASSASFVFWGGVPDTFAFGGLTVIIALAFAAYATHRPVPLLGYVAVLAAAMGVTITNVSVGLITAWSVLGARKALRAAGAALLVVLALWTVQKWLFPSAGFFLGGTEEWDYVLLAGSGTWVDRLRTMFVHSIVMPSITWGDNASTIIWPALSIEHAGLLPLRPLQGGVLGGWAVLLAWGTRSLVTLRDLGSFRLVLALSLMFQVVLHLIYGDETFLYSLHWTPMLAVLAALSLKDNDSRLYRLAFLSFVAANALHNGASYLQATRQLAVWPN